MEAFRDQYIPSEPLSGQARTPSPANSVKTRILYGVQGTGNGHISRAAAMNKALTDCGLFDVQWVMSGRPKQALMCCDEYHWYRGMTFATSNGRIEVLKTIAGNNVMEFFRDIGNLSLDEYDLVISDFEPVVSWSARKQGRQVMGIGHQYAFCHDVPVAGRNPLANLLMQYFAPADIRIGLHWDHFNQPILPPIVDMHGVNPDQEAVPDKVLVYLPFEYQDGLVQMLREMPQWQFYIYSAEMEDYNVDNIHTRAISKTGFKNDLVTASAIITNSGFELISECLTLGKRILTKPLHGQVEQLSNAKALNELGYATVVSEISQKVVVGWLEAGTNAFRVDYPDVARAITQWIADRDNESNVSNESVEALSARLWRQTLVSRVAG